MKGPEPRPHLFLEIIKLGLAGAVAGVIDRGALEQTLCRCPQPCLLRGVQQVKAAHQNVGPEGFRDLPDPFVGAAAEQDPFSLFPDQQVLLMTESLRLQAPFSSTV